MKYACRLDMLRYEMAVLSYRVDSTEQFTYRAASLAPRQNMMTSSNGNTPALLALWHYNNVIMSTMGSQITSLTIVNSTVYSGADQRKYQSSASLAFVRGIHWWPGNSPHKGQWRGVLMCSLICVWIYGWANNRNAGDLRRHRVNCDFTVMKIAPIPMK